MNSKTRFLLILVACLIVIGVAAYLLFPLLRNQPTKSSDSKTEAVEKCSIGKTSFKSDVLGVKFCYPEEWGVAKTEPVEYLTKLNGAVDQYSKDADNAYSNSLIITFSKNASLDVRLFNEKYGGEYYPNARAYDAGYIDNISTLKKSGNICDYKINFDGNWDGKDTLKEILNECPADIKTVLIENTRYFDKILYEYQLESMVYKKAQNGVFDNLLATYSFARSKQLAEKVSTIDELYNNGTVNNFTENKAFTNDYYTEQAKAFKDFIKGIKIYKPIKPSQEAFKEIKGEDTNITLIRKYYWNLTGGKVDDAYNSYSKPAKTLDEYKTSVKDFYTGTPRDFRKLAGNKYDFYLDYQAQNTKPAVYHYVVNIMNNKIEFEVSEEITTPMVKSGDYTAYAKRIDKKTYLILKKGDEETVVEEGSADYDSTSNIGSQKIFHDIKFSDKTGFLIYLVTGYEWQSVNIYDITKQEVVVNSGGSSTYGIDSTETHAYTCASGGMSEAVGSVYSLPGGSVLFDVYKDSANNSYMDIECSYDKNQQRITMVLSKSDSKTGDKTIKYDLSTEKVAE